MQGHSHEGPLVSVGMPVYNGEAYLVSAVDSILSQTFTDLELIISDNASTDATESICRQYVDEDSRVRYIRTPDNRGAMWNFNEVFRHARGKYYKPASHDDLHAPQFLERCLDVYREAPSSVVLVYPRTVLIDGTGEKVEDYEDNLDLRGVVPSDRLRQYLRNVRLINAQFGLHRRVAYASTRRLQHFVSADTVLMAELALRGEIWELPERLFYRRDHAGRSEHAHDSYDDLLEWYDPNQRGKFVGRRSKLFIELFKAIGRAPLPTAEQLRCLRVVLEEWGPRYGRVVGGELKQSISALARRSR